VKVLLADDDTERAGALARILVPETGLSLVRLKSNQSRGRGGPYRPVRCPARGEVIKDMEGNAG
jgi:hypothetical protein